IDGWRLPDRSAAPLPVVVVLRPGLAARLARRRDRVKRPDQLAVLRTERLDAAANAAVSAAEADDDHAVVVERGADDRVPLRRIPRLDRPQHLARLLVEREQLRIELADENPALAEADAARDPAAAHFHVLGVEMRLVLPQDVAGVDIDGEHV